MDRPEKETLPVWLQAFNFGARGTDWGGVMAGSTLITVPVIVFFLLVHRRVTLASLRGGQGVTPAADLRREVAGTPAGIVRRRRAARMGRVAGRRRAGRHLPLRVERRGRRGDGDVGAA